MKERILRLREALSLEGLGCLLVTKTENIRYVSGFGGSSAAAVITPTESILITDGRYREQAFREAEGWDVRVHTGPMVQAITETLPKGEQCGFEVTCSYNLYQRLAESLPDGSERLQPTEGKVEDLRVIKDDTEVELIRSALEYAAVGFEEVRPMMKVGTPERTIAAELDYRMVLAGADGPAFDTLVASGPNSAMPHAPLTDRELTAKDAVVVDFGALRSGYRSDTTRTVILSGKEVRREEVMGAVGGALRAALEALKPGIVASEVDSVAREYMAGEGFSEYFSHSLGHGVGLETHEKPTLSSTSTDVIEPGMVFTVEPGIYIEGWGGVRIEEMVLMTPSGPEILSAHIG